jgi:hypothetical protein
MIVTGSKVHVTYCSDHGSADPKVGKGSTMTTVPAVFLGFEKLPVPEEEAQGEEMHDIFALFYVLYDKTLLKLDIHEIEDIEPFK